VVHGMVRVARAKVFAAVAVVAELAEAGRGRRQQNHPARPGLAWPTGIPPVSHRYPTVTAASGSGRSVTPAKATARISSPAPARLSVCGSLVRLGLSPSPARAY
jgi:hypothetical protein